MKRLVFTFSLIAALIVPAACRPAQMVEVATVTLAPTRTAMPEPATPTPTPVPDAPTHADLPYVDDGQRQHRLDVYLPEGARGPLPTLIGIPGINIPSTGGITRSSFHAGTKEKLKLLARHFSDRGYAVVAINYRYPSESLQQWETEDAFCALAWVHANAGSYGFDPQRIAVLGDNFSGMIAAKVGMVDEPALFLEDCPHTLPDTGRVAGVVTHGGHFFTPKFSLEVGAFINVFTVSFETQSEIPYRETYSIFERLSTLAPQEWREGQGLDGNAQKVARLLPLYWLDGSEPPFLLLHGDFDPIMRLQANVASNTPLELLPPSESLAFADELRAAGVDVETVLIPDASYNGLMDETASKVLLKEIEGFLGDLFE